MVIVIRSFDNRHDSVGFSDYLKVVFDVEIEKQRIVDNELMVGALNSGARFIKNLRFTKDACMPGSLLSPAQFDLIYETLVAYVKDNIPKTFVEDVLNWRKSRNQHIENQNMSIFIPSWNRLSLVSTPTTIEI